MSEETYTAPTFSDNILVQATHTTEDMSTITVSVSGHVFFQMSYTRSEVQNWIDTNDLAGRVFEIVLANHPAAVIVNDLMPLLPGLMHRDAERIADVADFKVNTVDRLRSMGYIK